MRGIAIKYTDEERKWIADNVKGKIYKALADEFNKKFNRRDLNERLMCKYCQKNKLDNGKPKNFKKGHVPANKGTKGLYNVGGNKTSFKKGQMPKNYRPVGSERVNVNGYVEVKVKDSNKWKLKHRVIWEEANGKIPDGHKVMFIDQDKLNLNLDNLRLVSRAENAIINKYNLIPGGKDLNNAGITVAKIMATINEIKEELQNDESNQIN